MAGRNDEKLMRRLRQAFLDYGYEQPTMIGLAKACDLTRRALYNHFHSKEEAFRGMIRWRHRLEIAAGMAAGRREAEADAAVVDILVAIFDARYGEARRDLERSPHALEINREAFGRCDDIMNESAAAFQAALAAFLDHLAQRGRLRLRPSVSFEELAQLLADGARGVNQSLPRRPAADLPQRYRRMCEALLYGCAELL
jgi:AcrR family transcriptional regulator